MSGDPILFWGAGAIGGTVGAFLREAGLPVLFVDKSAAHVKAINNQGLAITGPIREFRVTAKAALPEELSGRFGLIFLCVKAQDTAAAADSLAPFLTEDGAVVSLQNGLNEQVIAARIGAERTVGAFVNFGADYMSPGVVHYGGRGAVVTGELDGESRPRTRDVQRLLHIFDERAVLTANIWGFLWSKLAYGALLFATALTNDSIADCLANPRYRPVLIALTREVIDIALANKITLEPFDGFDPKAFMAGKREAEASLDALVAHNRKSAKTHSGIWRDLAVRKRKTEVRPQLEPVVAAARSRGLMAPLTRRTIALIVEIEDGARPLASENLDELAKLLPNARAST
ncbi:ketopantoate reductase family protein [Taklimakanibacter deserti]|uniref:ketopantoate reductase family protein n=1 Tax=Taklimakanibacter deserti TaxID=2267839 RepID=UPI000E646DFB